MSAVNISYSLLFSPISYISQCLSLHISKAIHSRSKKITFFSLSLSSGWSCAIRWWSSSWTRLRRMRSRQLRKERRRKWWSRNAPNRMPASWRLCCTSTRNNWRPKSWKRGRCWTRSCSCKYRWDLRRKRFLLKEATWPGFQQCRFRNWDSRLWPKKSNNLCSQEELRRDLARLQREKEKARAAITQAAAATVKAAASHSSHLPHPSHSSHSSHSSTSSSHKRKRDDERDGDKSRDRDRHHEKNKKRDREKDKDRHRDRDKEREKERERDRHRDSERDKDKERDDEPEGDSSSLKHKKKKKKLSSSSKDHKKDTKLYCICKTPYDESK